MSFAYLDFKIRDLEIAAYDLATYFTKQRLVCRVIKENNGFSALIAKQRFFKNVVGTPTVMRAHFFDEQGCSVIEVSAAKVKWDGKEIIRETLLAVTVLPGLSKVFQYFDLERKIKKQALIIAKKLEAKGEK